MRAKLLYKYFAMTKGKEYEVLDRDDRGFHVIDDEFTRQVIPVSFFEVIPDEPSAEPAATTNVVDRPKFKPGDKVRLREFAYGTNVKASVSYGSTETIREVFKVQDNLDGKTQHLHVQHLGIGMSSLWFDLVEAWDPAKAPAPHGAEPAIRTFETGATRNLDSSKNDYEGFLSPLVIKAFGDYMTSHRKQKDGTLRDSDNWQKGIPIEVYMKSMFRHFMDVWTIHRGGTAVSPDTGEQVDLVEALNAVLFNVQGMMHETLKKTSQK